MTSDHLHRIWGSDDIDVIFGAHDRVITPWPSAPRPKRGATDVHSEVSELLAQPPLLTTVDPRQLYAGQPWILRQHVTHYLAGVWERTGRTSADRHAELNRFPVVRTDHRGRLVLVSGHHRAATALIRGRMLPVRYASTDPRVAITANLVLDPTSTAAGSAPDAHSAITALLDAGVEHAELPWLLAHVPDAALWRRT